MLRGFFLTISLMLLFALAYPAHADDTVLTLWPLIDYRASDAIDYRSYHLLGPIIKYETKGDETEYALRPFFYRATNKSGESLTDVLYPISSRRNYGDTASTQVLQLYKTDTGDREEENHRKFYLFPFFFSGEHAEFGSYGAIFPLGGSIYGWFGRDKIEFTMFPLYSRTQRGTTRVDNILWPFFARVTGEGGERGFKIWPIYGQSEKPGEYAKAFFFWPIMFSETTNIQSGTPTQVQTAFPFYYSKESPSESTRTVLWPFFSHKVHHEKGYEEWYAPWPLIRIARGETVHGDRFLPMYADERTEETRKIWCLWPVYRIDVMQTDLFYYQRDRVLFFLYSDLKEQKYETGADKRRVLFWPLFGFLRNNGVSHFYTLALLEPFLPENEGIERSWSPLWRLYQQKWDTQGNHVVSLLWNLFWREQRGTDVAWELFPLVDYRNAENAGFDLSLLKGLFRFRSDAEGKQVNLFYLPWGISWGRPGPLEA